MAALVVHVSVRDDDGITHSFGPGDDIPAWARRKITNPKVWDEVLDESDDEGEGLGGGGGVQPPPLAGPGSGRDQWAEYADQFGDKVQVSEDDKRDEIVAKLREAGVRVE